MSGRDDDDVPVDAEGQDDKVRLAHHDNIPTGHELAYDPPGTDEWADERKKEMQEHQQHQHHHQKEQDDEDQGGGNAGGCRVDGTGCPRY